MISTDRLYSVKSYKADELPLDRREILRYAGTLESTPEADGLLSEVLSEILPLLTYRVCFREFELVLTGDYIDLGFATLRSRSLARHLRGCDSAVLFGATIGIEPDRLMNRYARLSPAKALLLQAVGAERIEAVAEAFSAELSEIMKKEGKTVKTRFSPGYGDLPLEVQKDIFELLSLPKNIGLTLTESCLMSPTKSVTAIIGIS